MAAAVLTIFKNGARDKFLCGEIELLSYSDKDLQKANARLKKTKENRKEYDEKRQAKISISQI